MMKYDAVIAGYMCVDFLPGFYQNGGEKSITGFFKPGKLIEINGMDFVLGGAVPNTGLAMKKFGGKVFLNGLIGNDFIGKIAEAQLAEYGASDGTITTSEAGTAFSIVLAPPGIDRIFLESPGCNHIFCMDHINVEAVSKSRLFHFGYPPLLKQFYSDEGKQLAEMYAKVREMGVITSLDFSLPDPDTESGKADWSGVMGKAFPYIDIFTPSLEEIIYLMMPGKYAGFFSHNEDGNVAEKIPIELIREIGKRIIDSGVKVLLIKMGSRGTYLLTGEATSLNKKGELKIVGEEWNNREIFCNAYHADDARIVNSSGAGDTAIGAFLTAILDGQDPEMAIKYASIAGRDNLYCDNIYTGMDNWELLTEKIELEDNRLVFYK